MPVLQLLLVMLLIAQTANLIYYLNRVNRDLANFLIHLHENNTSIAYSKSRIERNFKGVVASLNNLNAKMQHAKIESEQKHKYLQAVVNHINVGMVALHANGNIEFMNKSVCALLKIPYLNNISILAQHYPIIYNLFSNINELANKPVKIVIDSEPLCLLIKISKIKFENSNVKLISIQNIRNELEQTELNAWLKFIQILRHEIMNSITPITTLTTTIKRCFKINNILKPINKITPDNIDDCLQSAEVIEERSLGLVSFIERFKGITNLPQPIVNEFYISNLISTIQKLFATQFKKQAIVFEAIINPPLLRLHADEKLIEQVLINLIKNSIEAINNSNGKILINATIHKQGVKMQVTDNGSGIDPEFMPNIFVPSFTTKENGSGIGLSLSKQIMQLHNGSIHAYTSNGVTCFELIFVNTL